MGRSRGSPRSIEGWTDLYARRFTAARGGSPPKVVRSGARPPQVSTANRTENAPDGSWSFHNKRIYRHLETASRPCQLARVLRILERWHGGPIENKTNQGGTHETLAHLFRRARRRVLAGGCRAGPRGDERRHPAARRRSISRHRHRVSSRARCR